MTFRQNMLRLKQCLNVSTDKEVAEMLGMTRTALAERKRRDAFPEDALRSLAQRRPDLDINVDFVLNGSLHDRRMAAIADVNNYADVCLAELQMTTPPSTAEESTLVERWRRCRTRDQRLILELVESLADKGE